MCLTRARLVLVEAILHRLFDAQPTRLRACATVWPVLFVLSAFKLVLEVALLCWLGRALLGLLLGQRRAGNGVYVLFQWALAPVAWLVRCLSPAWVLERHRPWAELGLLWCLWLLVTGLKVAHCLSIGLAHCR